MNHKPILVMQSDFGLDSGLVSCMHGICKLVDRDLEIYDSSHLLPAFDIRAASFCLQYTVPCWPAGTIFVSVVDPGVGTSRKASVAKLTNGSYVVTPDNGTLTYLYHRIGIAEIREIDETRNRYQETLDVSVFHGRDLFSYCAAKLASGQISFEETGAAYPPESIVQHPVYPAEISDYMVKAKLQSYDPFGSAELSVTNDEFVKARFHHGDLTEITITLGQQTVFHDTVPYEKSFGYVDIGRTVIFNDLGGYISISCNQKSFLKTFNLDEHKVYDVVIRKAEV